jgi:hypothetical protein
VAQESFLSDEFLRQLISVGEVDLLVGIASHNSDHANGRVMQATEEALLKNFPRDRAVIINLGGASKAPAPELLADPVPVTVAEVRNFESLRTLRRIAASVPGPAEAGTTLRTILAAADLLSARACAVVSDSTEEVAPSWIDNLLRPIYRDGFDFVAPLYSRHKFDGLLANNLLYPLTRAVYAKSFRELLAPEFAFSGRLAARALSEEGWREEAVRESGPLCMAVSALSSDYRCCQTFLGPKSRGHQGTNVVSAIRHSVGGLFWCLDATASSWLNPHQTSAVRTIGPDHEISLEQIRVDRKKLLAMFRSGVTELSQILASILAPDTHAELFKLLSLDEHEFFLSNPLWVRVIYEFAASYHHSILNRDHLVQALVPVYRGRSVSFLLRHRTSSLEEIEADTEDLCQEFARQKDYFLERWKTKGQGAS